MGRAARGEEGGRKHAYRGSTIPSKVIRVTRPPSAPLSVVKAQRVSDTPRSRSVR